MTQPSIPHSVAINRALIGIIAITTLVGAGTCWIFAGSQNIWTGACLKVGLVMAALWLALPAVSRHGNWGRASLGTVIGFVALVLFLTGKRVDIRIVLPMLIGIAIAVTVLRPKSKIRPK